MTSINFGVGTLIGKRTDVANTKPAWFGIAQECTINFDVTLKELIGDKKLAFDVAPSALKITGTIKNAKLHGPSLNNLLFDGTETIGAGSEIAVAEAQTWNHTTFDFTITNGGAGIFIEDLGVFSVSGLQYQPVTAGAEAKYKYSVNANGKYTAGSTAADAAVLVYYKYAVSASTMNQYSFANQVMGAGPVFEFNAKQSYNFQGALDEFNIVLNACRISKWSMPFKNSDYTIQDIAFQAFADINGNWGSISVGPTSGNTNPGGD